MVEYIHCLKLLQSTFLEIIASNMLNIVTGSPVTVNGGLHRLSIPTC